MILLSGKIYFSSLKSFLFLPIHHSYLYEHNDTFIYHHALHITANVITIIPFVFFLRTQMKIFNDSSVPDTTTDRVI